MKFVLKHPIQITYMRHHTVYVSTTAINSIQIRQFTEPKRMDNISVIGSLFIKCVANMELDALTTDFYC